VLFVRRLGSQISQSNRLTRDKVQVEGRARFLIVQFTEHGQVAGVGVDVMRLESAPRAIWFRIRHGWAFALGKQVAILVPD